MKRARPIRKHPIRRSSRRIRSRKKDPARRRFAKRRCQPYLDWLKGRHCQVSGESVWRYAVIDPAHVRARGAGGCDLYNALSLAHHLHEEQHHIGLKSFEAKYGVDLLAIAHRQTEEFLELYPEYRIEAA